jgi:hypothetical protein
MRTFLALTLLAMALPQTQTRTQTNQPNPSGLEIVNLIFEKKWAELGRTSGGMVSLNPPVIAPIGRAAGGIRTSSGVWNTTVWISKAWVYDFRAEMRNDTSRRVTSFVWAYHLPESSKFPQDAPDKEYLCNVRIEPGETKLVKVRSTIPPSQSGGLFGLRCSSSFASAFA